MASQESQDWGTLKTFLLKQQQHKKEFLAFMKGESLKRVGTVLVRPIGGTLESKLELLYAGELESLEVVLAKMTLIEGAVKT